MSKIFLLTIFSLLFLSSCSFFTETQELKRRNLEEFYQGSEVVRFFLPPLPDWANQSQTATCKRSESVDYLKIDDLMATFRLDYQQAIQFQYMYNIESRKRREEASLEYIPFKENEKLFYSISDRIQARIFHFIPPKFNVVNLIWIDQAVQDQKILSKLKKLMKSKEMDKGHPVFVSLCLSKRELENFRKVNNFSDVVKLIPYELFSPYDSAGKLSSNQSLNFEKLFKIKKLKLNLYQSTKRIPIEFVGKFKLKKY